MICFVYTYFKYFIYVVVKPKRCGFHPTRKHVGFRRKFITAVYKNRKDPHITGISSVFFFCLLQQSDYIHQRYSTSALLRWKDPASFTDITDENLKHIFDNIDKTQIIPAFESLQNIALFIKSKN